MIHAQNEPHSEDQHKQLEHLRIEITHLDRHRAELEQDISTLKARLDAYFLQRWPPLSIVADESDTE